MHSDAVPRTLPPGHLSRTRYPDQLASAPSGDHSVPPSQHYVLTGDSHPGIQNQPIANRQSIDLSSDPSRSNLHFRSDPAPWNPVAVNVTPTKAAPINLTGHSSSFNNKGNHYTSLDGFHDSALGTFTGTGPSHDDTQSIMSPTFNELDDLGGEMDGYTWLNPLNPQEVEPQGALDEEGQQDEPEEAEEEEEEEPRSKQKSTKQPCSEQELSCDVCGIQSKTRSDKKKHMARHDAPFKCPVSGCARADRGFATVNDLARHEKSVHQRNTSGSKNYKCLAPDCSKADKEWPRLDNFKQHLQRMHKDLDVDELVAQSGEWYEAKYGDSGLPQSAAVTGVLHDQEKAARASGQTRKRRRGSSPPSMVTPNKRIRVQTSVVPPQDHTHLSPMSAQMTRSPSSFSQQPNPHTSTRPMQSFQSQSYQGQGYGVYGQQRGQYTMGPGMYVPSPRRRTEAQARPPPRFPTQVADQYPFTSSDAGLYNFGPEGPATQPPPLDQQTQYQQQTFGEPTPQRPHTAPDTNPNYTQIRRAHIQETHPVPPSQDDFDGFNSNHALIGMGYGQSMPRSSPDTSNGPQTPNLSVQLPIGVVDNESDDDDEGRVRTLTGLFSDHIRAFIRHVGTKSTEKHRLLSTRDFRPMLESVIGKPSLAPTSEVGTSHKSMDGASSRSGKTNHICPKCQKQCPRQSDLKKHLKRHSRPYGCVLDNCYKRFGSKNDLKRHETKTHAEQKECYRCDGSHRSEDGQPCFQVFYYGRDNYKKHLETYFTKDPHQIEKKANICRIPANNQGRFWCGFCKTIVVHETYGPEASTYRLSHIDAHFSNNRWAVDWIELGGNGLSKGVVEIKQNQEKNQRNHAIGSNYIQRHGEGSQPTSTSSSSPEQQHGVDQPQAATMFQSQGTHRGHTATMERRLSSVTQPQQRMFQQEYQQMMAQQMQRARSQGNIMTAQPVHDLRDPPPRRHYNEQGQLISTQARCCACGLDWPLDLGRKCTNCDHDLCVACKKK